MQRRTEQNDQLKPETLDRALMLACRRIADSNQSYEEANTPEGWYEEFVRQAESNESPSAARM